MMETSMAQAAVRSKIEQQNNTAQLKAESNKLAAAAERSTKEAALKMFRISKWIRASHHS